MHYVCWARSNWSVPLPRGLGGPNQQRLLAALAIHRGEAVSVSSLVDVVWPDGAAPARAEHNIRTYVHRLRSTLGDEGDRIETVGVGYRLRLGVEELDAARFEWLVDVASRTADTGEVVGALEHIGEAERLWLGPPLAAFVDEAWAMPTVARLSERHANLRELRARR